ncbi:MAG: chorismate synthase [Actinomycetia bacterium]|nr:chorismate synthase [Actinomycetes bacterium]
MRFLTAGESHGKSLVGIVDDFPSGVTIDQNFINQQLKRRQSGYGRGQRMDIEEDTVEFLSGLNKGVSTGNPISFLIANLDWKNWKNNKEKPIYNPRPGHADLNGVIKYHLKGIRDVIERSSARETAARVCAGALAREFLSGLGINIYSYVDNIGGITVKQPVSMNVELWAQIENSELRVPDKDMESKIKLKIKSAGQQGDTLGGSFKVLATNVPPGLGTYSQWDKRLDGMLAQHVMSIPAIKAVEVGDGFDARNISGTEFHDEIFYSKTKQFYRKTNHCGGIEGGISNGQDIILGAVMKPIPTTTRGLKSVNIKTKQPEISLKERSDVCAVPSASIVAEAMMAIVLAGAVQDKFGRDSMEEILKSYNHWKKYYRSI